MSPGLSAVVGQAVKQEVLAANADTVGASIEQLTAGAQLSTAVLDGVLARFRQSDELRDGLPLLHCLDRLWGGPCGERRRGEGLAHRQIIATKIPVRQLLAGKVLGNTALALAKWRSMSGWESWIDVHPYSTFLPSVSGALVWFAVFFLVGFLLLACLWAVAGALASRSEDLQATSMPLTMLTMMILFGAMLLKGTALTIASYVPPMSAVLMPVRVIEGSALWWEPVVAIAILLAAALGVIVVAERLYRRSLLQTQGRVTLRQAWSAPE